MITMFERRGDDDAPVLRHILTQLTRPNPADAELVLKESVDGVDRAILLLLALDQTFLGFGVELRWIPAITSSDDKVLFIADDECFLGMLELEISVGKKALHGWLKADPDRFLRHG